MYFGTAVDARACLVQPPAYLSSVAVLLEDDALCGAGASGDVVGSEVEPVVTVGGVSETGRLVSLATPLTSPE